MLLGQKDCEKVQLIKSKVLYMIEERTRTNSSDCDFQMPSKYWSSTCDKFKYMLGLSDEYYGQLRLHTYHLDSDCYQKYHSSDRELRMKREWYRLIRGVPEKYR